MITKIFEAGVVGAGGAGFPTHIKYGSQVDFLLVNGAECEPLLYTDQREIEDHSHEILAGIELGLEILGAKKAKIAIKAHHKAAVAALKEALEGHDRIELVLLDSYYPAGDEHSIVYDCLGKTLEPGALPSSVGAVVSNVTTLRNIYLASKDLPVTHKKVTVTGEVKRPVVLSVPLGTPISDLISRAGGPLLEDYALLLGGPMMGKMVLGQAIDQAVVTKTTGGVILLGLDHPLITRRRQSPDQLRKQTASACIQCNFCTQLCPRYLKGHPLHPHQVMKAFGLNVEGHPHLDQASLCCECGICELFSCPMGLSPRIVNQLVKKDLRDKKAPKKDYKSQGLDPFEGLRRLPSQTLIRKIHVDKYEALGKPPYEDMEVDYVKIPLSQHIGKPAQPLVAEGDWVDLGQKIAGVDQKDLGANIHASISGQVLRIADGFIEIKGGSL
ncbi:MAG: SLBB domain-containing protein [Tissierellia bacterium]|nr:SLBB domain-containing protein [Tissierellia bacterium]